MSPFNVIKRTYFDIAVLVLRVFLGIWMIKMSSGYLFEEGKMEGLIAFLEGLNWPFARLFAYSSQGIEFFAGILIILGFRLAAGFLFAVLSSAAVFAHGFRIFQDGMLPAVFAILSLAIFLMGCGKYSLDHFLTRQNN